MCYQSNKVIYLTRKIAKKVARERGVISKVNLSVYKCHECNGFHLTSLDMENKIRVRESRGDNND